MKPARKTVTLRQAVLDLAHMVKALVALESDLLGIDSNYEATPRDCEGPQALLDKCQQAADVRYRLVVGKAARNWTAPDDVRRILSAIESLAEASGAAVDTARRTPTAPTWTQRDEIYEGIESSEPKERAGSKYRLAVKVALRPDGSLARPLPRLKDDED